MRAERNAWREQAQRLAQAQAGVRNGVVAVAALNGLGLRSSLWHPMMPRPVCTNMACARPSNLNDP